MAVIIRLSRHGAKSKPFYRIVAADKRYSRDGRFLEIIGTYDPRDRKTVMVKEAAEKWIKTGARMSDTVKKIFAKEGVTPASAAAK